MVIFKNISELCVHLFVKYSLLIIIFGYIDLKNIYQKLVVRYSSRQKWYFFGNVPLEYEFLFPIGLRKIQFDVLFSIKQAQKNAEIYLELIY